MATKTEVHYIDDLDGSTEGVETIKFGLWGASYEIDLTKENQSKLEAALEPYLAHARKANALPSPRRAASATTSSADRGYDLKALRAWAQENDITVPARGRIPKNIIDQYLAAH